MIPMKARKIGKSIVLALPMGEQLVDLFRRIRASVMLVLRRRRLQRYGFDIVGKICEIMKTRPNVVCFVDFGTLLGFVREGGFIKHDDDIDFTIKNGTLAPKELMSIMLEAGFEFNRGFICNGVITELAFTYKKVGVDFFYAYDCDFGQYVNIYNAFSWDKNGDYAQQAVRLYRPASTGMEILTIKRHSILVPVNREELLSSTYGQNWRTPVKAWQASKDDGTKRERIDCLARIFHDSGVVQ